MTFTLSTSLRLGSLLPYLSPEYDNACRIHKGYEALVLLFLLTLFIMISSTTPDTWDSESGTLPARVCLPSQFAEVMRHSIRGTLLGLT